MGESCLGFRGLQLCCLAVKCEVLKKDLRDSRAPFYTAVLFVDHRFNDCGDFVSKK